MIWKQIVSMAINSFQKGICKFFIGIVKVRVSQLGAILPPWDTRPCPETFPVVRLVEKLLLASDGERPEMLSNIL